ncbi:O-antigen ligase family protein [Cysteiniphilum halobium]|uniref:O-antigen ligase family protein n=1 Tax=Cysteiniphilum halobium TaxID=2219059 RepID=UPI003F872D14
MLNKKLISSNNTEHFIYGVMLIGLILVFWSPIGMMKISMTNTVMLYVWRGLTALFCWIVILALFTASRDARNGILSTFHALSIWVKSLIVLFFCIGIISASLAFHPATAFKGVSIDMTLLLSILFLANYFQRFPENIRWLIAIVIICAISYTLVLILNVLLAHFYFPPKIVQFNFPEFFLRQFNFANPRFFDHFASWFLPILCLPLLSHSYSRLFKLLGLIAMASLWFVVIAHSSRALILEYIVITVVLGILNYKILIRFLGWQIFAFIIGAIVFYLIHQVVGGSYLLERNFLANQDRWSLWAKSLTLAAHHPLLGVGELNALYYLKDYPHNIILTIACQWGIIGLACFLLVGLRAFRRACEYMPSHKQSALYFVAFASVLAGMTHALVSNIFKLQLSQFSLIFAMGLLLSFMPQTTENNQEDRSSTQKKCHLLLMALCFILIILLFTLPFLYQTAI